MVSDWTEEINEEVVPCHGSHQRGEQEEQGWYQKWAKSGYRALRTQGLPTSTHSPEGCLDQVLCHGPQTTFCCHRRKKNGEGTFLQELALGDLSSHCGSSQAGPKWLRQPSTHSGPQGLILEYTSCCPITSCHSILDARLDTSSSWSSLLSLFFWSSHDPSRLSCLSRVSSQWFQKRQGWTLSLSLQGQWWVHLSLTGPGLLLQL